MATWQQWEGRIINGRFPLRQYLGGAKQSAVYLTEINGSKAAIKFIPSDAAGAQLQISRWESARALPHPHLLRILDTGRWHPEGEQEMVFAVMEYGEENLAEILPGRRLTPTEASEMLHPALDVLDYLHGHGMVQGNIKPTNIMAVEDTLKLSSDGIRPVGNSEQPTESFSVYDPPERAQGEILPSGDVWSLGMVLVEAFTNRLPSPGRIDETDPELPENIPEPFAHIAKHCLSLDPGRRWSTTEIRKHLDRAPVEVGERVAIQEISAVTGAQEVHAPAAQGNAPALHDSETIVESLGTGKSRGILLAVAVSVTLVVIAAGVRLFHHGSQTGQPASSTSARQSAESSLPPPTDDSVHVAKTTTRGVDRGAVTHEVLPDVPRNARSTITGKVRVTVRVVVDKSGAVSHAVLVSRGPSEYFADKALQAARKWTFTPPTVHGRAMPSDWSLSFQFKKDGTTAMAQRISPSP